MDTFMPLDLSISKLLLRIITDDQRTIEIDHRIEFSYVDLCSTIPLTPSTSTQPSISFEIPTDSTLSFTHELDIGAYAYTVDMTEQEILDYSAFGSWDTAASPAIEFQSDKTLSEVNYASLCTSSVGFIISLSDGSITNQNYAASDTIVL